MTEETITIDKLAEVLVRCEARDLQVLLPRRADGPWGPATPLWNVSAVRDGVLYMERAETLAAACVALCAKLEEAAS
jgi:hypothetical protein